jgi:hypothetical protein
MKRIAIAAAALVLSTAAGCGGGGGGSGVDGTKSISTVGDADKASLCDWFAGTVGGYGAPDTCADGFISAPPTKTECIATFPTCAVTVDQFEACVTKIVAAQNACTAQALSDAQAYAPCQTVGQAGCFD